MGCRFETAKACVLDDHFSEIEPVHRVFCFHFCLDLFLEVNLCSMLFDFLSGNDVGSLRIFAFPFTVHDRHIFGLSFD